MKSKLNYLISVSFKRKVCSKWFIIVNAILAVAIMAIANIDSIISFFGGDFNEKQNVYVIDNTNETFELFKNQMMAITSVEKEEDMGYVLKLYDGSIEDAKKHVEENKKDLFVIFDTDEANTISVKLMSLEYLDILESQYLQNAIYNTKVALAIQKSEIPADKLVNIYANIEIDRIILDETKNKEDESMEIIMSSVFPVIILPVFMLIIYLVQMIGAEVNDEKTTKGMEIIISSVSPNTHFFAKIVSSNLFVILQGGLLILYGVLGLWIRKFIGGDTITGGVFDSVGSMLKSALDSSFMDKLIYIIPVALLLLVLTFIAYSLVAGILASMTTNTEDFQQIQTPIVIVLLVAYYLAILAGTFKGAVFIKVLSIIPFISAILAPSLLVIGEIGLLEIVIATVLLFITNLLLIKYGLRIYKVGILNYSSTNLWGKMLKALKTK